MDQNTAWQHFESWCREHREALPCGWTTIVFYIRSQASDGVPRELVCARVRELGPALLRAGFEDVTAEQAVQDELEQLGGGSEQLRAPQPVADEPAALAAHVAAASSPLPTVHLEHDSAVARKNVEQFMGGVAAMFEAWVARRENPNTQRAYRTDVLSFVQFVGIPVLRPIDADGNEQPLALDPGEAHRLLRCGVGDVQEWRDYMVQVQDRAPKTVLRRITSLSRFYEYVREQAAEFRIATTIPNPAHKNHIPRFDAESVRPTDALTPARIRQLKEMAPGESPIAYRDRAIIRFYLYTGARIRTGCLLRVEDCQLDAEDSKLLLQEKGHGSARRAVGIHFELAEALQEYVVAAELSSGPLFRARKASRSDALSGATHQRDDDVSASARISEEAAALDAGGRTR